VFGALHVESVLAIALRAGLPDISAVGTETSVAMLIRLGCVLKTLHTSNGR
jgi:hypothetical protein